MKLSRTILFLAAGSAITVGAAPLPVEAVHTLQARGFFDNLFSGVKDVVMAPVNIAKSVLGLGGKKEAPPQEASPQEAPQEIPKEAPPPQQNEQQTPPAEAERVDDGQLFVNEQGQVVNSKGEVVDLSALVEQAQQAQNAQQGKK